MAQVDQKTSARYLTKRKKINTSFSLVNRLVILFSSYFCTSLQLTLVNSIFCCNYIEQMITIILMVCAGERGKEKKMRKKIAIFVCLLFSLSSSSIFIHLVLFVLYTVETSFVSFCLFFFLSSFFLPLNHSRSSS